MTILDESGSVSPRWSRQNQVEQNPVMGTVCKEDILEGSPGRLSLQSWMAHGTVQFESSTAQEGKLS